MILHKILTFCYPIPTLEWVSRWLLPEPAPIIQLRTKTPSHQNVSSTLNAHAIEKNIICFITLVKISIFPSLTTIINFFTQYSCLNNSRGYVHG